MRYQRTPLTVPRYVLTVKYALFIALGIAVGTASTPSSFEALTPDWYTPIWGAALSIAAFLALLGGLKESREPLERWSVSTVACLLIGYATAPIALVLAGDTNRLAYSIVALTVALAPAARAIQLLRRTGTKSD